MGKITFIVSSEILGRVLDFFVDKTDVLLLTHNPQSDHKRTLFVSYDPQNRLFCLQECSDIQGHDFLHMSHNPRKK